MNVYVYVCMSMCVCVCVCMHLRLVKTTSGMMWTSYVWLNKFYNFYVVAVVSIVGRCGITIEVCRGNNLIRVS